MNNPFDWQAFQKQLKEHLPQLPHHSPPVQSMDFSWIEEYVKNALEQSIKSSMPTPKNTNIPRTSSEAPLSEQNIHEENVKVDIFEIHHYVIAKINVPEHLNPRRIRCSFNANRISIKVLPHTQSQLFQLPSKVETSNYKARFKAPYIEIQLRKDRTTESFYPIHIEQL